MTVYFTNSNGAEFEYDVPDLDDGVVYVPSIHIKPSTRADWTWPRLVSFAVSLILTFLLAALISGNFRQIRALRTQNELLGNAIMQIKDGCLAEPVTEDK